ncbi:U7 snRNA-associated Sm-like protein LSm11 [Trichomycterus rosablanca]|uniref:U7 snRNA-associated Sm-like protein LSm11 n=1 Tax=Trichomycterus rosablanca TaxID=2290929 RepID=UPI002F351CA9
MEERERKAATQTTSIVCKESDTCTEEKADTDCEINRDLDEKLDISSDQFDPLLALYSSQVPLPYPDVKCFNNIAEYESFIKGGRGRAKPENVEKKLRKARKGVADPERIERLKRLMVNNPTEEGEGSGKKQTRKQKPRKNVLTRMSLHEGSPLGELNRCVQQRVRVKVHIRTFKGLRGVCTGFVVAFDKFWNLAMVDVDETYREPLLGQAFYHEKALTVTRLFEKLSVQERQELSTVQKDSGKGGKVKGSSKQDKRTTEHQLAARSSTARAQEPSQAQERSVTSQVAKSTAVFQGSDASSKQKLKASKPRVEYGRVRTRHVNQLFIRGENVLLVNVQQE